MAACAAEVMGTAMADIYKSRAKPAFFYFSGICVRKIPIPTAPGPVWQPILMVRGAVLISYQESAAAFPL